MHIVDVSGISSHLIEDFFRLLSIGHGIVLVAYLIVITLITFSILRWKITSFWPVIFGTSLILPMWWIIYFTGINTDVTVSEIHKYLFFISLAALITGFVWFLSTKKPQAPVKELVEDSTYDISPYE